MSARRRSKARSRGFATALDPATRTMRVEIDLPNPDEKLQPGMYGTLTLGVSASIPAS